MLNATQMLLRVQQFGKLYKKLQSDICDKYDLSHVELDVLLFLNNNPQCDTAKDIVELRGLAKSYVSKAVDLLIKKKLISTFEDKHDRRIIHLNLEEKSKGIIEEGQISQYNFLEILYKNISPEEREIHQKVLNQMSDNIREVL